MLFGLKQFNRNRQLVYYFIIHFVVVFLYDPKQVFSKTSAVLHAHHGMAVFQVSNVSFADFDLDLTELGGPITWDGSDVPDTCLTPWTLPPVG